MSRLDAVLKRCEDASPEPWGLCFEFTGERDRAFIAAARTDLPDLARDFRVVAEALREWDRNFRPAGNVCPFRADGQQHDSCGWGQVLAICDAWLGEAPDGCV